MKICWDNLEKLRYNIKTGKWYDDSNKNIYAYNYIEFCPSCKEPFLQMVGTKPGKRGNFCSQSCANSGKFNCTKDPIVADKISRDRIERYKNPKNHPNYIDGSSIGKKQIYCADWKKLLKEEIKERDNYKCQNPDCWRRSKILTVHHIDYDKKNCKWDNLITLCNSCNVRANYKRDYWRKLFDVMRSGI